MVLLVLVAPVGMTVTVLIMERLEAALVRGAPRLEAWEPGSAADGRAARDSNGYVFLTHEAPTSINPRLWRQSLLAALQGLFGVVEGIDQVRGRTCR